MEAMDVPHREAAAELYESIDAAREAVNCYIAGEVWILVTGTPLDGVLGPVGWLNSMALWYHLVMTNIAMERSTIFNR